MPEKVPEGEQYIGIINSQVSLDVVVTWCSGSLIVLLFIETSIPIQLYLDVTLWKTRNVLIHH